MSGPKSWQGLPVNALAPDSLTYEEIAKTFKYNPITGELWRIKGAELLAIKMARETNGRYDSNQAEYLGHKIRVTHICFMLIEGRWPNSDAIIDHRDGDVWNCRWSNLREGPQQYNMMNQQEPGRPSLADTSGLERGVYRSGNRYRVQLSVNGTKLYLGTFTTKEEANEIAKQKRVELHGEWLFEASRNIGASDAS